MNPLRRRGFTLVEVLIVAVIMTLIGGAIMVLALTGRKVSDLTNARLTTLTDAERAVARVTEDLRLASQQTAVCNFMTQVLIIGPPGGPGITYTFNPQNRQLTRSTLLGGGAMLNQVVASGLTAFQVQCDSKSGVQFKPKVVQVTVTAQDRSSPWPLPQTLSSQIWIRNP